jgi:hypothetical protein
MWKILLCIILVFVSCNSEEYIETNTAGQSLYDNENLVYDNYRHSLNETSKIDHTQTVKQQPTDSTSITCKESCVSSPLRIVIVPMSFSHQDVLSEINNTIALVRASKPSENYTINVINGEQNIMRDLLSLNPDIIVGPFGTQDIPILQKQLKEAGLNIPVISLATRGTKNVSRIISVGDQDTEMSTRKDTIHNLGYKVEDDVASIMDALKKKSYKHYTMFAPNNDIGASSYETFTKYAKKNKQEISRVEFYETDNTDITKYINRLKNAINQTYYENVANGKFQEDNHTFANKIASKKEDTVILKNGTKYHKKTKTMDAIIIDASVKDFPIILDLINQDRAFDNVLLVASPRTTDAIIEMLNSPNNHSIEKPILFPSNFGVYRAYYEVYKNTFNKAPTRLSTTVYETVRYILDIHERSSIKDGLDTKALPVFTGLNGTIVVNQSAKTVSRFVNVSRLQNGRVEEIVDSYKQFK